MDVLVKDIRLAKWELVQSCKGNSPKLHDILAKQFCCFGNCISKAVNFCFAIYVCLANCVLIFGKEI